MSDVDVVVIGSGPGGYVAAIRAAQLGMNVAVVERGAVGGRCLNHACIPAKAVLRVADAVSEIRGASDLGIAVSEPRIDYAAVGRRRQQVIDTLTGGVSGLLRKHRIELVAGTARLAPDGVVAVSTADGPRELCPARGTIIATGSVKRALPGTSFGGRVIGTEEAWALSELPQTLAVVGAGASGVEIASAYVRLGVRVSLFEGLERVLPSEDHEVSAVAERGLRRQGIDVHTGVRVEQIASGDDAVSFVVSGQAAAAEWLVVATGRGPDVEQLGLDDAGIALTPEGLIAVDATLRTNVPGIWAIGDVVPGPALAHKASDEGVIAAEAIAGRETHPLVHQDIPRATFCRPNVASFGLTEQQAIAAGHEVVIGRVPYGAVGAGTVYGDRAGLIKVVGDERTGDLLGGHIVGAKATDLIQELVTARALEGGFADVARIVHGHPTMSEGVMEAARAADGWLVHG